MKSGKRMNRKFLNYHPNWAIIWNLDNSSQNLLRAQNHKPNKRHQIYYQKSTSNRTALNERERRGETKSQNNPFENNTHCFEWRKLVYAKYNAKLSSTRAKLEYISFGYTHRSTQWWYCWWRVKKNSAPFYFHFRREKTTSL